MKKQLLAMAAVLGLAGFATVNATATTAFEPQSRVFEWATVVFCEAYEDGRLVEYVCQGGHNGIDHCEWLTGMTGIGGGIPVLVVR